MNPRPRATLAVSLRCGTLHLTIERAEMKLEELCGFASRRNRKRGFVFVSKVLGKHYPVRPHRMAEVHTRLASQLGHLPGPAVLIALAETATGLGQGIYESWLRQTGRTDALFLHSTRYRLQRPLILNFEESHSHATEHLLYQPSHPEHAQLLHRAVTLVLIDDEISTGRTLVNLARAHRRLYPQLSAVHLVCLTDWLSAARRTEISGEIGVATAFHSLLQGRFEFTPNPTFDPGPIPDVTSRDDLKDVYLSSNHGRSGVCGLLRYDLDQLVQQTGARPGERLLVLGSGEFAYPPYLLARRLEELGWDVHYQSTTRSPLLLDRDLTHVVECLDNYGDEMPNYLYNVGDRHYDRVVIGYETYPLPTAHTLPEKIGAIPIFF